MTLAVSRVEGRQTRSEKGQDFRIPEAGQASENVEVPARS
jgi:hypothetical protein